MPKIADRYIKFGTNAQETNDGDIPSTYTPANYTPESNMGEGADKVSAQFKGIDNKILTLEEQSMLNSIVFG